MEPSTPIAPPILPPTDAVPDRGRGLRGIRARLGALSLAVAVPLVVLFAFRAVERKRAEEARLRAHAVELVTLVARTLDVELRGTATFLAASASILERADDRVPTDTTLAQLLSGARLPYTNLYVIDSSGTVRATARALRPATTLPERGPRSRFRHALRTGTFQVGDVVRSRVRPDSAFVLSFYQPIRRDGTGPVRAVLGTAIPLDSLAALRLATRLPPGSVITALDSTGRVVLRTLDAAGWIGREFGRDTGVARNLRVGSGVDASRSDDGTDRYTAYTSLTSPRWIVYVGLPERVTTDVVRAQFVADLGVGGAIVLLVALASWQAGMRIVRPIESLTADARAIAAGDESRRSQVRSDDEIGTLSEAFNRMADTAAERRDALLASQDQLRQSQKMEALGAFAGGISHDFNNYLAAIRGYVELAAASLPPDAAERHDLEEALRVTERASALTRQILVFSRHQVVSPTVVDPAEVLHDVERLLTPLMGAAITVRVERAHGAARVRIDAGQLEQVLVNLGANARDAMPDGGRFTLASEVRTVTADATRADGIAPGTWVVFVARDTGRGIPEPVRARLFDPFFTTKERGRGTGLGLALVWSIVRQAGGTVLVESVEHDGTTFEVWLPAVDADVDADVGARADAAPMVAPRPVTPVTACAASGDTVLVVEDDEYVRHVTVALLRRAGYTVHETSDAESALAFLESGRASIVLVVSDVAMPGMGGAALAHAVHRTWPALPVLLLSGYADDERIAAAVALPGVSFLAKPFTGEALVRAVRGRVETSRLMR